MGKHIYLVAEKSGKTKRLIMASNSHQALKFVAEDTLTVTLASQTDLVALTIDGVKVEKVVEEDAPGST